MHRGAAHGHLDHGGRADPDRDQEPPGVDRRIRLVADGEMWRPHSVSGMEAPTTIEYQGIVYRRYPNAKQRSHRVYYQHHGTFRGPVAYLHRVLWETHHGPIPPGHHVHHKDGNPFNNDVSNLECVDQRRHKAIHAERGDFSRNAEHLDRVRHLASEWHRSDAGREWHRQHGRELWANREVRTLVCEVCGESFETRDKRHVRYCSNGCGCKARSRHKEGASFIDQTCLGCGKKFRTSKLRPGKCCSAQCVWDHRKRGTPGVQPDGGG